MSIVEMQKIHLASLKKHQDTIVNLLKNSEVIDIQQVEEGAPAKEPGEYELQLAEIKSVIAFLETIGEIKKGFIESFFTEKKEISKEKLTTVCREFDCKKFIDKCKGIESKLTNLKNLKTELNNDIKKLLPWRKLDVPLQELGGGIKTCVAAGKIRTGAFADFKSGFEKFSDAVDIVIAEQTKEEAHMVLLYLAAEKNDLVNFLSKTGFEQIILPISEKTPGEEIKKLQHILSDAEKDIEEDVKEAKQLLSHLDKIKYIYDHNLDNKSIAEAKNKFIDTSYTFVVEGWIKKSDYEKLLKRLAQITPEAAVSKIGPRKGEKPPVALKNAKALSPFELITNIYGTPKPDELDPTGPLSFFFALFFGICLGDFGYGLVLIAFSLYFLRRYQLPKGGVKLFNLLIFGGGVATIVGLLTGSYLGFTPKDIPVLLPILSRIQIIDPIKNPLTMLGFSLALGVVQILFGISLQMAHKIMNRQFMDAILDDGLWIYFLSSLVFLIISSAAFPSTVKLASNLSIAGAVLMVLTQGRHKKNIVQKFLSGLLSLYKLSGYMGDVLSYSRLLALGMSTTIIGSVINILAGMVKGGVPILGVVLMVILLIFGHIFNLVIGTLGAFVHSTRLQMVEFFSKFYEGGGREFRPFKREAEFTIIKEG
ncbi:MAG: V-type ATP synthase subunit I [Candidatus Margulisiibacteriota bacterium]|nr:V-type ATP synthase subunit I [Candidatus Margulisiibacteriota bacterium]